MTLSLTVFQDAYPKGVIPLAAIQMARPAKDNKFEIVTSHRIFVFRTDSEGDDDNGDEDGGDDDKDGMMNMVMMNMVVVMIMKIDVMMKM